MVDKMGGGGGSGPYFKQYRSLFGPFLGQRGPYLVPNMDLFH